MKYRIVELNCGLFRPESGMPIIGGVLWAPIIAHECDSIEMARAVIEDERSAQWGKETKWIAWSSDDE